MTGRKPTNMDQRTHERLREVAEQRVQITEAVARASRLTGVLIGIGIAVLLALLANLVAGILGG